MLSGLPVKQLQTCRTELKRWTEQEGTSSISKKKISLSGEKRLLCSMSSTPSWKVMRMKQLRMMKFFLSFCVVSIFPNGGGVCGCASDGLQNEKYKDHGCVCYSFMEMLRLAFRRLWFYSISLIVPSSIFTVANLCTLQYFSQSTPLHPDYRSNMEECLIMGGSLSVLGVLPSGTSTLLTCASDWYRLFFLSEWEMVRSMFFLGEAIGKTLQCSKGSSFSALLMRYLQQLLSLFR